VYPDSAAPRVAQALYSAGARTLFAGDTAHSPRCHRCVLMLGEERVRKYAQHGLPLLRSFHARCFRRRWVDAPRCAWIADGAAEVRMPAWNKKCRDLHPGDLTRKAPAPIFAIRSF